MRDAVDSLREAEFGNFSVARQRATDAAALIPGQHGKGLLALVLARSGDQVKAKLMLDELNRDFPKHTLVQFYWLPTVYAAMELRANKPEKALDALETAKRFELSGDPNLMPLCPVYLRGNAFLQAGRGKEAAAEFQRIVDHRGIVLNTPLGALAHLQLGRAYGLAGDTDKARGAYQKLFTLWKDGDPDIPILQQAKAEYAKLK